MSNFLTILRHSDALVLHFSALRAFVAGLFTTLAARAARAGAQRWRRWLQAHRQRQLERAMFREFAALSDATLRDIGMSRGELSSYHAEASGQAEVTRLRVMRDLSRDHGLGATGSSGPTGARS
jgi:predicted LPLAT superfamily acyltransferase